VPVTTVFSLIVLSTIYFLWATAKEELAPPEDQGVLIMSAQAAPNSTLQQRQLYTRAVYDTFVKHPETDHVFQIDVPGQTLAGMVLKPWNERKATAARLLPGVTQSWDRSRDCAPRSSSLRRCPEPSGSRCSSSSRRPSPSKS